MDSSATTRMGQRTESSAIGFQKELNIEPNSSAYSRMWRSVHAAPASSGLDPGCFGLIHLVNRGVVRDLGRLDEPGIEGLSFRGQAVMLGKAFRALREHDNAPDLSLFADADRAAE